MDELEQEHFHEHEHTHEHNHAHPHEHDHADDHKHPHHHENTKYVQNRLARASGHLQHVRAMVDSGEDCSDVLMQLSAVIGALQSIAKVILKDHLDTASWTQCSPAIHRRLTISKRPLTATFAEEERYDRQEF